MDRSLREHIEFLKKQLYLLSDKLMDDGRPVEERNRIESEVRAAQLALEHYKKALALEESLRR
ncbi:MAG TPA: hypothetical protein VH596_07500 [Terriglobales bacterium]|jgi:hypothetical protein